MKNIFQFCVIFMTASMFLTSCGSSLSVTKRQHSKGYFVTSNKKYSSPPEKEKVEHKKVVVTNQALEQVAEVKVKEIKKTSQLQDDYSKTNTKINVGVDKNKVSTTKSKKASSSDMTTKSSSTDKKLEQSKDDQPRTIKTAINKVKSSVSSQSRSKDQGLSLLWIIIIVLLVLWALGLIGGLGSSGLLHILLVVALILLILWLLRII